MYVGFGRRKVKGFGFFCMFGQKCWWVYQWNYDIMPYDVRNNFFFLFLLFFLKKKRELKLNK